LFEKLEKNRRNKSQKTGRPGKGGQKARKTKILQKGNKEFLEQQRRFEEWKKNTVGTTLGAPIFSKKALSGKKGVKGFGGAGQGWKRNK